MQEDFVGKTITEKTLVPLSLVVTLVTGAMWVKDVAAKGDASSSRVDRLVSQTDKIFEKLNEVAERLTRIEANQNKGK